MKKINASNNKKSSTFEKYVAERSDHIEKMIEHTLHAIDATKFGNLTDYCKAIAVVVTQIRAAKAGDATSPFYNKPVRSFSHITLLRNKRYRHLVEGAFNRNRENLEEPEVVSEEVRLQLASLNAQLSLLKNRLSGTKTASGSNALADARAQQDIGELKAYLEETLTVYTKLRNAFDGQTLMTITHPTARYTTTGLYSPFGKIAEIAQIQNIEEGRKFLIELSKRLPVGD